MDYIKNFIHQEDLGELIENESMKYHTSMRTGGEVKFLYIPNDVNALIKVLHLLKKHQIKYFILGKGSNLLFPDGQHDLFVIKISKIMDEFVQNNNEFTIGAGTSIQMIAKKLSKMGYSGFEFAGGIPGTFGGAIYMNAGAHTHDMSSIIKDVKIIDENFNIRTIAKDECDFHYRNSIFHKKDWIIIEATIKLEQGDAAHIFKQMAGNLAYRKEMQPLELPSCGSSFKNPPGNHAGKLIEDCGLKGYVVGGAQVSEKHANFIVNINNASSTDVLNLIDHVVNTVDEKTGIKLTPEMETIKVEDE
jgi:UDP-N-acetylmuramate dehydrogenase